jgi:aryl carrier-like protein
MVPAACVHLAALPLTPNGKLDRKALPAPEGDAFAARAYEAPRSEVERALAAIWAELLQIEKIGRLDHFFELGGHSLMAITLISRMRALGLHVDMRTLFTMPTIADLATVIGKCSPSYAIKVDSADFFKPCEQNVDSSLETEGSI